MRMNAVNLLAALVTIFGVGSGYVVLKQGNWYNPQATVDNSPGTKPKTWVAVRIDGERKVDLPHYVADAVSGKNWSVVHKIAKLTLQFVGDQAEDLANSVAHWTHNQVVRDQFAQFDGTVFGDCGDVIVTDFDQQGANTVFAYNVEVKIGWADEIDTLQTRPMESMKFTTPVITVQ
jgi:hypothetical protein